MFGGGPFSRLETIKMPLIRSPSIIMRAREFGESDLLIDFFTRDQGRLKGVAKGGRRSRRRFSNALDIFCLTELEYEEKRGDLFFLHSGRLLDHFGGIREQYERLAVASYIVELTEILFPLNVSDKKMFDLLEGSLRDLAAGWAGGIVRMAFEAAAMALGGFAVSVTDCCVCGRSYEGRGRAVLLPARGAIACLRCAKETPATPGLSPEAVSMLKSAQGRALKLSAFNEMGREAISELKNAICKHMDYRLGRMPASGRFLTS